MREVRPAGWWLDGVMVAGFLATTLALAAPAVRRLDLALRDLGDAHRPHQAELIAQVGYRFGSGGLLTGIALALALLLGWRRRSVWPLAPVVAAFLLTGVVIQPLKLFFHRAAPHSPLPDDVESRLFSQPGGLSYPSGHAVNAVVWYGVIVLLVAALVGARSPAWWPRARRWLTWAPSVVVFVSSIYLGYHWLTDMVAGVCLAILVDRAIHRVPWVHLK